MNAILSIQYKPISISPSTTDELAEKNNLHTSWAIAINGVSRITTQITIFGKIKFVLKERSKTILVDGFAVYSIMGQFNFLNITPHTEEAKNIIWLMTDFIAQSRGFAYWSMSEHKDLLEIPILLPDGNALMKSLLGLSKADLISFRQQY